MKPFLDIVPCDTQARGWALTWLQPLQTKKLGLYEVRVLQGDCRKW